MALLGWRLAIFVDQLEYRSTHVQLLFSFAVCLALLFCLKSKNPQSKKLFLRCLESRLSRNEDFFGIVCRTGFKAEILAHPKVHYFCTSFAFAEYHNSQRSRFCLKVMSFVAVMIPSIPSPPASHSQTRRLGHFHVLRRRDRQ